MTTPMTIEAAWAAPSSRTRAGAEAGAGVLFSTVEGMWQEYSVFPHPKFKKSFTMLGVVGSGSATQTNSTYLDR